jgi:hypothetical protein
VRTISLLLSAVFTFNFPLGATETKNQWIEEYIITVPDFPKAGIQFKCYPDLLKHYKQAFIMLQTAFNKGYEHESSLTT